MAAIQSFARAPGPHELKCHRTRGGLTPAEDEAIRAVSALHAAIHGLCPEAAFRSLFNAIKKTLRRHPKLTVDAALALNCRCTACW